MSREYSQTSVQLDTTSAVCPGNTVRPLSSWTQHKLCVQGIQSDLCPVGHNISCVSREYSQTSVQLDTTSAVCPGNTVRPLSSWTQHKLCVQGIQSDLCPVGHNISCVSREYSQTSVQLDTTLAVCPGNTVRPLSSWTQHKLCVQGIQSDLCPVGHNISCVSREYSQTSVQLDTT